MASHRGDIDELTSFLLFHMRQCGGDPVKHAFDMNIDGPVPILIALLRTHGGPTMMAGFLVFWFSAFGMETIPHNIHVVLILKCNFLRSYLVASKKLSAHGTYLRPLQTMN
jgi:hypothetical protein